MFVIPNYFWQKNIFSCILGNKKRNGYDIQIDKKSDKHKNQLEKSIHIYIKYFGKYFHDVIILCLKVKVFNLRFRTSVSILSPKNS